jgi:hypothetical protein
MTVTFITKTWAPVTEDNKPVIREKPRLKAYLGMLSLFLVIVAALIWYPTNNPGWSIASIGIAVIIISIASKLD